MKALVSQEDLQQWCGYEQRSKIEIWLRENNISYIYGKGNKLVTTQAAIDKALIGPDAANEIDNDFI